MTDEELTVMAAVVRQVKLALRDLRVSERLQARLVYFVVKGLHDALQPPGEQRWQ